MTVYTGLALGFLIGYGLVSFLSTRRENRIEEQQAKLSNLIEEAKQRIIEADQVRCDYVFKRDQLIDVLDGLISVKVFYKKDNQVNEFEGCNPTVTPILLDKVRD